MPEFDALASALPDVRRRTERGLLRRQCRGRLVARQLDHSHVVLRVPFDVRDVLVRQAPEVFEVPSRYAKHMSVVADLTAGDPGVVQDALDPAWQLQAADVRNGR